MVSFVTNSGDFRRYSYSMDAAYALKAFDVHRTSAAPSYAPERQRRRELKVHENPRKKSLEELRRDAKAARLQAVKIFGIAFVAIGMLSAVLCSYVQKNELNHEIASIESQIDVASSENTRLNSELDALVSVSMIDQYAVEKLGMTKVQSGQIRYVDVAQYKEERAKALEKNPAPAAYAQIIPE